MPKSVLIVEDEALIALDLETHLHKLGYEVPAIASSGMEAIQMVKEISPDLVLMDIRIKGAMDGIEAAEHISRRFEVPVIYITAHTDRSTLDRAKLAHPFGFVAKPVTQGNLAAAVAIALHKHAAEKRVRQREAWLATTLNSVPHAMIVTDSAGKVRFMNEAAEWLTGVDPNETIGRDLREAVVLLTRSGAVLETDLVRLCVLQGRAMPLPPDLRLRTPHGRQHEIEGHIAPSTQGGIAVGAVLTLADVTDRNRNETQRKRAEVARAIARLAAATYRDLSDLLTVILSSGQLLQQSLDPSDVLQQRVQELMAAGESAVQVTTRLMRLAREEVTLPAIANLNELVSQAETALVRSARPSIELATVLGSELPLIFADPVQIRELITLLVSYASASMPQGGRIEIETGSQPGGARAQRFVRLIVRYDGPAMERDELEQFFGASKSPRGTRSQRVDLFMVLAILADVGGHISVHSTRPGTNWFEVLLPEAVQEEVPPFLQDAAELDDSAPAILVIEPDVQMRQAMCDTLARAGCRCIPAADDADALFAAQLYEGSVEVVVAAPPEPGAGKPGQLIELLTGRPEARVLIMTPNMSERVELDPAIASRAAFLTVPFQGHELREAVEALLDRSSKPEASIQ